MPQNNSWQNSPAKTRVVFDTRLVHRMRPRLALITPSSRLAYQNFTRPRNAATPQKSNVSADFADYCRLR